VFRKILIANRGEIACRIARTCREHGVATVAVYSDADRDARHVLACDQAVALGGTLAAESYLRGDRIIEIAQATGAEAIHPGYGFLAQNAAFARACAKAGIVFIGPSPEATDKMGSKDAAKALMQAAGVPVVPGYHGAGQDDAHLAREAERVGYPLMIKAVAGGGGKGMRRVDRAADFQGALNAARREAKSAFGDDKVLLERFITKPRHIEVQVFGDSHGNVIHLYERECSLQRRYQKVIEETPSPFLDEAQRAAMGAAAVKAAQAVGYTNAGTVEFIVGADHAFYFMEMNTRLQVEHPVTEQVTGLDLVEWQLRVAAGERLPRTQTDIPRCGHSIEARLCAEDATKGFVPATGRITRFVTPPQTWLRVDSGFATGDTVSPHYDSMLAKLIVHGGDRAEALARLREALAETVVFGVTTNLALLRTLAADPAVNAGDFDTQTLDARLDELLATRPTVTPSVLAAAHQAVAEALQRGATSPWAARDAWRLGTGGGLELQFRDAHGGVHVTRASGAVHCARVELAGRELQVTECGVAHPLEWLDPWAPQTVAADETHPGSPMPGRVVAVEVKEGDTVAVGQALVVLEGMKMEITLRARVAGRVAKLHCAAGQMVEAEVPLVDIEPEAA
jgi:3-methylcrotonyl-CoA carboxylase alpha subunit